jgi:hypothetical protein
VTESQGRRKVKEGEQVIDKDLGSQQQGQAQQDQASTDSGEHGQDSAGQGQ